jgi:hypothetical protein
MGVIEGALRAGHGAGHGAWLNATVWSECRARAADFFEEIAALAAEVP